MSGGNTKTNERAKIALKFAHHKTKDAQRYNPLKEAIITYLH